MFYISFVVCVILYYVYWKLVKKHNYWKKRSVPYIEPQMIFGNYREYILMKKYQGQVASEICEKFPDEPYIGTFYGTEPALLIQDSDIIKLVMNNDFNYFTSREITDYSHKEAFTNHLFFQGGDEWKVLRQNLNPLFTSSKIKQMFPHIKDCVNELEKYLETETNMNQNINVKSLLVKYTMDCIMACAFGINANCLKTNEGENPFIIAGEQIFDTSIVRGLKMACRSLWPSLFYGLGFRMFDKNITEFFHGLFTKVSNSRIQSEINRNDFVNLISELKKNSHISGLCYTITGDKKKIDIKVNDDLLVANCAGFFAAGFETTASSLGFLLYELAKSKDVQDQLITEIDSYLQNNNGAIDYECINGLPYTEACIDEALRLYPVLGVLTREVTDEYILPTGLRLDKGTRVHIPVYHVQRRQDYFPEPEKFQPERFLKEQKKHIKPFSFLPFGEGPRLCIGMRFAKMPMHAVLLTIFKKYRIELAENMPLKVDFRATGLVTHSTTDIYLKFIRRD